MKYSIWIRVVGVLCLLMGLHMHTIAQTTQAKNNVLHLSATVNSQIVPDIAVVTMAYEKNGQDVNALTQEVNRVVAKALEQTKQIKPLEAYTGVFNTYPQYDNKGQVQAWVVRSELVLKSKDFAVLGKTVGDVSKQLKIVGNQFEISPQLKQTEEEKLIVQGLQAFQKKSVVASKTLGFKSYELIDVQLNNAQAEGEQVRPVLAMARGAVMSSDSGAPMPIVAGRMQLSLTVTGEIQMR